MKKTLAWINCYGAWDPDTRHPIETIGYDNYLESVSRALAVIGKELDVVWLSGGMIENGLTECDTTKPELERRISKFGLKQKIHTDVESITSISIVRKFLQTWQDDYPDHHGLLFCDVARYEINKFVVEKLGKDMGLDLPSSAEIVVAFEREDVHPASTLEFQQKKIDLMHEIGISAVEEMEIAARSKA